MSKRVPKYRRHRFGDRKDLAFVEVNGRRHYLGGYNTEESRERYARFLAGEPLESPPSDLTVVEVCAAFLEHAKRYYRRADGTSTGTAERFHYAIKPLRELCGRSEATSFGPRKLKAVRQHMIAGGGARTYVKDNVNRIRMIFKWAAGEELVPASVYQSLQSVGGLRRGRGGVREAEPVRPAEPKDVERIRPFVSRQVWTMVELQLLTAARSGEIVIMRPCDVDRTRSDVWLYRPRTHKTAHHGQERTIYLGPRAQRTVQPFLLRSERSFMFSPGEAEEERLGASRGEPGTSPRCHGGTSMRRKVSAKRHPQDKYSPASYRRAIARACRYAGIRPWHPHQLRHCAATRIRRERGIEVARVICGHRSAITTELYAEVDRMQAIEAMKEFG